MNIRTLLYDGFDELDALAPYEELHSTAGPAGWRVERVTPDGAPAVTASPVSLGAGVRLLARGKAGGA
jgi:hypothetical protein